MILNEKQDKSIDSTGHVSLTSTSFLHLESYNFKITKHLNGKVTCCVVFQLLSFPCAVSIRNLPPSSRTRHLEAENPTTQVSGVMDGGSKRWE